MGAVVYVAVDPLGLVVGASRRTVDGERWTLAGSVPGAVENSPVTPVRIDSEPRPLRSPQRRLDLLLWMLGSQPYQACCELPTVTGKLDERICLIGDYSVVPRQTGRR